MSILVGTLIENRKTINAGSVDATSGVTGSLFLLLSLLIMGGAGAWLYLNWEKAESLLLNLPPESENKLPSAETLSEAKTLRIKPEESFLLELSPVGVNKEANFTIPKGTQLYRAKINQ